MARIFISFAIEDKNLRDLLVGQKRNTRTQIGFTDYSVKDPWPNQWKTNCRERINQCAGMIGIITRNTSKADGQLWELECAVGNDLPLLLIHGHPNAAGRARSLPSVIGNRTVYNWSESAIVGFLNRL